MRVIIFLQPFLPLLYHKSIPISTTTQIITYVRQIASALDYAHEQRVIHRDVKPANLLLNSRNEVVLSDFGLAVVERTLESLSEQNTAGTPLYMAPEQIQRHPCPASDQYALGVMVYEWLCGEPPFSGPGIALFGQHLQQAPPSLCARLPYLPRAVEDAVFGALAKDPAQRFATVQEFALVLEEACFATQPLSLGRLTEQGTHEQKMPPVLLAEPISVESMHDRTDETTQPRVIAAQRSGRAQATAQPMSPALPSRLVSMQTKLSVAQRNRQILLRKVRSFWIEGVLNRSLHGAALMALGLEAQPNAIANPWHLVLQQPEITPRPLPAGTRITQVYDDAEGELLILGAPGAGKTTLLLELTRDLLARAQHDERHPMPVVFNLSLWADKQQSLAEWLGEELHTKYDVPAKLARTLVEADLVLPLLDGLDEVAVEARTACIEAINTYRQEHGCLPLVVCSRAADYLAQTARVRLGSAVQVQPLTQEQVDASLALGGEPLWALRVALHQDATLRELTSTPLMLSILTLTYHGKPVEELLRGTSIEERQRQIFEQYVGRMLTRRGSLKAGTAQQVVQWLTFLAARMRGHNQAMFYLEQMQPDWLTPVQYRRYVWLAVRLPALLVGILASLVITLVAGFSFLPAILLQYGALGGFLGWLYSRPASARGLLPHQEEGHHRQGRVYPFWRDIPLSIIVGLIAGLSIGLRLGKGYEPGDWPIFGVVIGLSSLLLSWRLSSLSSEQATASKTDKPAQRWKKLVHLIQTIHGQRTLLVIAIVGLSYGLIEGLIGGLLNTGLSSQLYYGLSSGLFSGLNSGLNFGLISVFVSLTLEVQTEGISLTERLRWTWKSLMRSLLSPRHVRTAFLIAGAIVVSYGLGYGLIKGLIDALMTGLTRGLSVWLLYGLPYDLINGLLPGLVIGLFIGLLYWILLGLFQSVSSERIEDHARRVPNQGIRRSLHNSMLMALISSGIIGAISMLISGPHLGLLAGLCGGLLIFMMSGGLAALRHGILRLLLQSAGVIPRHYMHFLDEAANCILLQKVGGGYSFVHRLLLDYFAALEKKDS